MTQAPQTVTDAQIDSILEEIANICENAYGGSSSQVWNDSFARLMRDMKSTGRTPRKFTAMKASITTTVDEGLVERLLTECASRKNTVRACELMKATAEALSVRQSDVGVCGACGGNGYSGGVVPSDPEICDGCEVCLGFGKFRPASGEVE